MAALMWRERIVEARARGGFTFSDEYDAQSFRTCAVAEQRAKGMPFEVHAECPTDERLYHLGVNFFWQGVRAGDFDAAEKLLDQIEDRALELKREA